jgi:hypothetical protein
MKKLGALLSRQNACVSPDLKAKRELIDALEKQKLKSIQDAAANLRNQIGNSKALDILANLINAPLEQGDTILCSAIKKADTLLVGWLCDNGAEITDEAMACIQEFVRESTAEDMGGCNAESSLACRDMTFGDVSEAYSDIKEILLKFRSQSPW